MSSSFSQQFWRALNGWWHQHSDEDGAVSAAGLLAHHLWEFARDSTPERRRQRYGDMEFDWEHRVDTTSGSVGWQARLLGLFHSPYQPTEPALFHEMMASLPIAFEQFTFIDIGSGKGRTLLMASEYPFKRIVGVELLPELHQIALENLAHYKSESQKCFALEAICEEAADFALPLEPLVLYLFNPLPEAGFRRVMTRLMGSLGAHPRVVYVLYHNPLLERVLSEGNGFAKMGGTEQYSVYASRKV